MKKIISFLLAVIFTVMSFSITALAENGEVKKSELILGEVQLLNDGKIPNKPEKLQLTNVSSSSSIMRTGVRSYSQSLEDQLIEIIYNGLLNHEENIDISSLLILYNQDNYNIILTIINYIMNTTPELFFKLTGNIDSSYKLSDSEWIFENIIVNYSITNEQYQTELDEYYLELENIVKVIPNELSDIEKVLFVYNYFALNYKYDVGLNIHDVYNFFTQHKGVCEAYSMAFVAVMNELGISSTIALDDVDNHAWNIVYIDDNSYNIDCTGGDSMQKDSVDDTIYYDIIGHVDYNSFLLSDDKIKELGGHEEYYTYESEFLDFVINCTDTKYDSGYIWSDSELDCPLTYCEGYWYFMNCYIADSVQNIELYKTDSNLINKFNTGITVNEKWYSYDENNNQLNSFWSGYFGNVFTFGNGVAYTTPNNIYLYNPATGLAQQLNSDFSGDKSIYGCVYDGHGKVDALLKYNANDIPVDSINVNVFMGITNNDLQVNSLDIVEVKKYILQKSNIQNWGYLDVSGDIGIDVRDLVGMKKLSVIA